MYCKSRISINWSQWINSNELLRWQHGRYLVVMQRQSQSAVTARRVVKLRRGKTVHGHEWVEWRVERQTGRDSVRWWWLENSFSGGEYMGVRYAAFQSQPLTSGPHWGETITSKLQYVDDVSDLENLCFFFGTPPIWGFYIFSVCFNINQEFVPGQLCGLGVGYGSNLPDKLWLFRLVAFELWVS